MGSILVNIEDFLNLMAVATRLNSPRNLQGFVWGVICLGRWPYLIDVIRKFKYWPMILVCYVTVFLPPCFSYSYSFCLPWKHSICWIARFKVINAVYAIVLNEIQQECDNNFKVDCVSNVQQTFS